MFKVRPKFVVIKQDDCDEWTLRVLHPGGSYAGLGVLNGRIEADLISETLNRAMVDDDFQCSKWLDYFEKP